MLGTVLGLAAVSGWPWMLQLGPVVTWLIQVLWFVAVVTASILIIRHQRVKAQRREQLEHDLLIRR